jgi:hypothetical protein
MSVPEWVGAGVVEECSKFSCAYIILILHECQQQEFVQQQQSLQHLIFGSVRVLLHMPREQSHLMCVYGK